MLGLQKRDSSGALSLRFGDLGVAEQFEPEDNETCVMNFYYLRIGIRK